MNGVWQGVSRWLRHFTMRTVTRFQALNAAVVRQLLPTLGLRTWTVDVDGFVSTGLQVERAARGYNPHRAQLLPSWRTWPPTHILRVKNRSKQSMGLPFRALWPQLVGCARAGPGCGFAWIAFFRQDVPVVAGPPWAMPSKSRYRAGSAALHPELPPGCRWRPA